MKTLRISAIVAVALLAFAADAPAKSKGKGKGGHKMLPPVKVHAGGTTIANVSSSDISVKSGKDTKSFTIDGHTSITVDGKKASAGDLRSGMSVDVTPSGLNPKVAMSIEASSSK